MKTFNRYIALCLIPVLFASCTKSKGDSKNSIAATANVIEVSALDFKFEVPDQVPSGWNTFRFKNEGKQEHFFYIYRLPDNKTYQQFIDDAIKPLNSVWSEYEAGKLSREEAGAKLGTEIAPWFFTELVPSGGPALTEPGETAQATVKLEPGLHVVECYVKMPDGTWHTDMGMQQPLTVTEASTDAQPPAADAELTLSNYKIESRGTLTAGTRTIAVHVKENPEGFMLHDINLFRIDDETKPEEIVKWMDWMDLEQFKAPAPGYSLGGMEHLAAGKTGYMTVDLQPGNYVWVSEGYGSRGMVETFTVE